MFLINVPLILQGKKMLEAIFFGGDVFSIMKMSFGGGKRGSGIPGIGLFCSVNP